jgi:hypothetical protein
VSIGIAVCLVGQSAEAADFYISPDGRDAWSGRSAAANADRTDGPFATLQRARDEIRKLKAAGQLPAGGLTVEMLGGTYELRETCALEAVDSGTPASPVVYRARAGEEVRLCGGRIVTGFRPVTNETVRQKLDPAAREHVLEADLRSLGIDEYGKLGGGFGRDGGPGLELFFRDEPMTIARWPNEGFIKITGVLGPTAVDVRGTKGCREGQFTYEGDRPRRWTSEKDAWVLGYWFWDWAEQRHPVQAIDPERRAITVAEPYHGYGYRTGQWFYGFNILAELDVPGEWYLDREAGTLYFWPPSSIDSGQAVVSLLPTLLSLQDTSHVAFSGFIFEAARGTAFTVAGGTQVRVADCVFRNLGSWAVKISGGTQHSVSGCTVAGTGDGGIEMSGGDRATLQPSGHVAENNHIHHWSRWNRMYRPGIMLQGVGQRAAHNLIEYSPHTAIGFGGNDHVIEFNEIHHVCTESNDAGAMYAGRDWTMRGTVIRYNYLHHINGFEGRGCVGVYLDDMFCGTTIASNVFYQVTRAAFIGGGRDNVVDNNVFVDCQPALHIDARALGWAHGHSDEWIREGKEQGTLSRTRFNQPPYSARYPQLPRILEEDPAAPRGNVVSRNICWGGRWDEVEERARALVTFRDNLLDTDPLFENAAQQNFQLRADSPAFRLGFERIPVEKIGRYSGSPPAARPTP